jgi:hypothetical protein
MQSSCLLLEGQQPCLELRLVWGRHKRAPQAEQGGVSGSSQHACDLSQQLVEAERAGL